MHKHLCTPHTCTLVHSSNCYVSNLTTYKIVVAVKKRASLCVDELCTDMIADEEDAMVSVLSGCLSK